MADDLTGAIEQIGADIRELRYDSGLRDLSSFTATDEGWIETPYVRAMRQGPIVTLTIRSLRRDEAGSGYQTVATLPPGMRPEEEYFGTTFRGYRFSITRGGVVRISGPGTIYDYLSATFGVRAPAPSIPPGDPV